MNKKDEDHKLLKSSIDPTLMINYQHNSIMAAKDNGILRALLTIAGIIGGAFIINELVERNSKKVVKYKCPTCQTSIDYQQKKCNTCNTDLKWNF